jgi:hypothetical protein
VKNNQVHQATIDSYWDPNPGPLIQLKPPKKSNLTASFFEAELGSSNALTRWFSHRLLFNNTRSTYYIPCEDEPDDEGSWDLENADFMQPIQNLGFSEAFARIALGMTNYIRRSNIKALSGPEDSFGDFIIGEPVQGTAWTTQTQIRVQWAWILYPVVLLVLTLIFFATTVLQSRYKKLGAWKSSTLPLLCAGLNENIQQELMASGDPKQVESLANSVKVKIHNREGTRSLLRLDVLDSAPH